MRSVLLVGGAVVGLSVRVGSLGCIVRVQCGVVVVTWLLVETRGRGRVLPSLASLIIVHSTERCFYHLDRPLVAFGVVHRSVVALVVVAVLERFCDVTVKELVPSKLFLSSHSFVQGSVLSYVLGDWPGVAGVFAPFFDRD